MPERKTLEEVESEVSRLSNNTVKIKSKSYVNSRTKMELECKCGDIFYRDYEHIHRGRIYCVNCSLMAQSEKLRSDFEEIKKRINDTGCTYISGEYINQKSKLLIMCRCGELFYKSWVKFKSGQDHCPSCGMRNLAESKRKYPEEIARQVLLDYGYIMIGTYIDAATPVECICKNVHHCMITLSALISTRHTGCIECARENQRGENHWNYKGGISIIEDSIRNALYNWKSVIWNNYNNVCAIRKNRQQKLVVHHLTSLSLIYKQALQSIGMDIDRFHTKINELSNDIIDNVINQILSLHNNETGILISEDIHRLFHQEYGIGDNTPQQFELFLNDHFQLSLKDIQIV